MTDAPTDDGDSVPADALRELVAEWREGQKRNDLPRSGLTGEGRIYKECADELEAVIEDE